MAVTIILKSGREITNLSPDATARQVFDNMSHEPGSVIRFGESFVLCSEVAAVIDENKEDD